MKASWIVYSLSLLVSTSSFAAKKEAWLNLLESDCTFALADREASLMSKINKRTREKLTSWDQFDESVRAAHAKMLQLVEANATIKSMLPQDAFTLILRDDERPFYRARISEFLSELEAAKDKIVDEKTYVAAYRKFLKGGVNEESVADRISTLKAYSTLPNYLKMSATKRILGQMTVDEVALLFHGGSPLDPTPTSLVGQYLAKTKNHKVVRTFNSKRIKGNDQQPATKTGPQGPERLVVGISAADMKTYQKLFQRHEFLIHFHTPTQGTLQLLHDGNLLTYSTYNSRLGQENFYEGTLLPHLLLSTEEAERLSVVFKGATDIYHAGGGSLGRHPWEIRGYCAAGGYTSCTHWIGNLPIGEKRVMEYTFPGNADDHAGNALGRGPQKQVLQELTDARIKEMFTARQMNNLTKEQKAKITKLLRQIWKAPGHEQLSSILGAAEFEAAQWGEYANPGYVAIRLLGNVDQRRVPIVFYMNGQTPTAFTDDFDPQIYAY